MIQPIVHDKAKQETVSRWYDPAELGLDDIVTTDDDGNTVIREIKDDGFSFADYDADMDAVLTGTAADHIG